MAFSKFTYIALLALASVVVPQIDPSSVDIKTRTTWCQNQKAACPLLCTQISKTDDTSANSCDPQSLAYNCVCGNGQVPNAANFSQTIPYYECQTANQQCADRCAGEPGCVTGCNAKQCGASNPTRINATSSGASGTATATATGTATGSAAATGSDGASETEAAGSTGFFGAPAATSTSAASSNVQPAAFGLQAAERFGLALVFAGLGAGFTLFL